MGNGIAHVFAQHGFSVTLIDVSQQALDKAVATITANLDRMCKKETITEAVKMQTLANITTSRKFLPEGIVDVEVTVGKHW
jgi:3-hydroxybutyryl-CoA dehydrogenase